MILWKTMNLLLSVSLLNFFDVSLKFVFIFLFHLILYHITFGKLLTVILARTWLSSQVGMLQIWFSVSVFYS